jgi:hypothetical protein
MEISDHFQIYPDVEMKQTRLETCNPYRNIHATSLQSLDVNNN